MRSVTFFLTATAFVIGCGGGGESTRADTTPDPSAGATEAPVEAARVAGPDTDGDGVPDAVDRCVDEAGPVVAGGCVDIDEDQDGEPEAWSRFSCDAGACRQESCHRDPPHIPAVYFPQGRAAVGSSQSEAALDAMVEAIAGHGEDAVFVLGHTSEGEREALALQRAEWVVSQLERRGVDPEQLQPTGFGAHWGKEAPPEGMSDEEASRRVELQVTWYGPAGCDTHAVPADKCPLACGG